MAQLVERLLRTQDVAGSNPARGSSFFLLRKKELSSGVVVYFALSLKMILHVCTLDIGHIQCTCYRPITNLDGFKTIGLL